MKDPRLFSSWSSYGDRKRVILQSLFFGKRSSSRSISLTYIENVETDLCGYDPFPSDDPPHIWRIHLNLFKYERNDINLSQFQE